MLSWLESYCFSYLPLSILYLLTILVFCIVFVVPSSINCTNFTSSFVMHSDQINHLVCLFRSWKTKACQSHHMISPTSCFEVYARFPHFFNSLYSCLSSICQDHSYFEYLFFFPSNNFLSYRTTFTTDPSFTSPPKNVICDFVYGCNYLVIHFSCLIFLKAVKFSSSLKPCWNWNHVYREFRNQFPWFNSSPFSIL